MSVSSHRHRLTHRNCSLSTVRFQTLRAGLNRALLLCILSCLMFMSQAMATGAVDREHAIEIAKEQNGGTGKVLGVATETDSAGNTRFAVKLLSNGRVRVFSIVKAQ